MADEILYYSALCYSERGIRYLSHFSLSILRGETLSIICNKEHEKKKLFLLLSGIEKYGSGDVYHCGRQLDCPGDYLRKSCFIIRGSSSIVDTLTVGENIFVLRQPSVRRFLFNSRQIHEHVQRVFDELGIPLRADAMASGLSPYEKYLLELVKAHVARAEIIFVDSAAKSFTAQQLEHLKKVYLRLSRSGVSLVFFTASPDDEICSSDRYAIFNGGQISAIFTREEFSAADYRRVFSVMPAAVHSCAAEPLRLVLRLRGGGSELCFFQGERVGILDLSGELFSNIYSRLTCRHNDFSAELYGRPFSPKGLPHCLDSGIVFANVVDIQNHLVSNLSVIDNVFLSTFHRLSSGIVLRRNLVGYVSKKYSGIFGLDAEKPVGELDNYPTQLSVYLERLSLCRPKVLICKDPFEKNDDYCRKLWGSFFERITAEGAAVIIISGTELHLNENCDRVIRYET